jgi:hypothetical protein
MQGVCAMGAVLDVVALEPFGGRGARDVEDLRRLAVGQPGVLDLLADFRGGTGLRMTARACVLDGSSAVLGWFCDRGAKSAINSSSIALARNKGQLRRGIRARRQSADGSSRIQTRGCVRCPSLETNRVDRATGASERLACNDQLDSDRCGRRRMVMTRWRRRGERGYGIIDGHWRVTMLSCAFPRFRHAGHHRTNAGRHLSC